MAIEVFGVALIPVIIGLVEVVKKLGLPNKVIPATSLVLGIVAGIVYVHPDNVLAGVLVGIALGLSASGLYSGVKHTFENNE